MKSISLPTVSVVIPTYNSAKFLPQALESVWQQTYTDYEVILIDDGSTDNTREVIEPYLDRLNYIYQPNQGVAAARNQGIKTARGELIAFLDADDLFLPQKLQQQVALFDSQPDVGMVVSGWQLTDETGKAIADVELWHELPELDLNTWLYWKPVLPSATMIRRQWLQKVGGFPSATIPVEDVECFLRLVAEGCQAVWCQQIGTIYRQINPQSLCRNTLKRVASLELLHQRLFASADLPSELRHEENRVIYCNYVWCAWHLYQNGYHAEMNDYLRKSLQYTTQSAAEISLNWIESLQNYSQDDAPINTYQLTQTPGWQQLTLDTLSTRQPKVSVIIPAYNSAKYLPEAIASVLEQTFNNYEIIVINDGSTDNTSEVIKPYLKHIRYFEQENQGVSVTRNRGIYLARGELIAFLDADDIFLPHKLEKQVAILDAQPEIGIVNSGFRLITETGEEIADIERWHKIPDLTPEIWLLHKPVLPSAMMFRKSWLLKVSGFDPRFFASEDVDIVLRMVIWGCQSIWLPEIVVLYRQHATSASWRNPIRNMANAELMQESFFAREDIPQPLRQLEQQARYDFLVWIACVLYQAGCIPEAMAYLKKSLLHSPYSWPETIVQWSKSFQNSARLNARPFDPYVLSQLPQWQELILGMRLSKVLDTYSDRATAYQALAIQKPEAAEHALFAATYIQLGKKLIAENDLEQALIWLRKAIALEPDNSQYQEILADAFVTIYDVDSAVATYRQALRLQPTAQLLQTKLESALKLQQQWRDLIDYCQKLMDAPPQEAQLKMLMIFPYPPYPPQKGGAAIRMFEQIKYFGQRHRLTVVAFVFDTADLALASELERYCDRAWLLKLGKPLQPYQKQDQRQLYNFKTWNMWRVLQQLSQVNFDVVSFEFIISTVYRDLFSDRFTVLNEHNIESQLLRLCAAADQDNLIPTLAAELNAAKAFLDSEPEAQLLAAYENRTWQQFPLRTVVSQANQQELDRRCHRGKTIVVKNGIDTQKIQPVGNPNSHKILFMGTMSYYPNIDSVIYFIEAILPQIWQEKPEVNFCIAGREPPQLIADLAQQDQRIQVIANPENMSAIAADCSLSVVPLRSGSGTRIKILHAMAMGLPVVSTSIGAEGLEVGDRQHLLIANLPNTFAQSVLELLTNLELWHTIQHNARQLVESSYDWNAIFADYEQELINRNDSITKPLPNSR